MRRASRFTYRISQVAFVMSDVRRQTPGIGLLTSCVMSRRSMLSHDVVSDHAMSCGTTLVADSLHDFSRVLPWALPILGRCPQEAYGDKLESLYEWYAEVNIQIFS